MWDDWRLNIFRGIKENRLKMEANKIARRKCWQTGETFEKCSAKNGMWRTGWNCKSEFDSFINCQVMRTYRIFFEFFDDKEDDGQGDGHHPNQDHV